MPTLFKAAGRNENVPGPEKRVSVMLHQAGSGPDILAEASRLGNGEEQGVCAMFSLRDLRTGKILKKLWWGKPEEQS